MPPLKGLLTIRQAAGALKVDPFTVQRWIWRKRLQACKRRGRWAVPGREVRRVLRERPNKQKEDDDG